MSSGPAAALSSSRTMVSFETAGAEEASDLDGTESEVTSIGSEDAPHQAETEELADTHYP